MRAFKYLAIGLIAVGTTAAIKPGPTTRIEFDAVDSHPEGIAFDPGRSVYYVSSARLGSVGKVTDKGVYAVLLGDSTLKSTYGMKIHPDGKRLFVCVGDANYSKYTSPATRTKMARLISIDLASGKKLSDVDLAGLISGKHFPNDLAFDGQNNIYVTDSYAGAVYKVTPAGQASVFAKDPKFITQGVGVNGIVFHFDGFLIVDNSAKGQLFKIDLKNPGNVQRVAVDQYFVGADGLLLNDNNTLTMVVNGGNDKIFKLESSDGWMSARVTGSTLTADRFTYPSTATRNGKDIWVMNAQFNVLLDSNNVPVKKFAIQRVVFKPVIEKGK